MGLGGLGLFAVLHLEKVPESGRRRLIFVSDETVLRIAQQGEVQLAREFGNRMLPDNSPLATRIRGIAQRLLKAGGLLGPENKVNWRVKVIDDHSQRNAFVMPSGLICVFTGIIDICDQGRDGHPRQNDAAIATVLGHEITHQLARHAAEKVSHNILTSLASLILVFAGVDPGLSSSGLQLFASLPNSRSAEREADSIGLDIMSKACYDAREAPELWKRMREAAQEGSPPAFLSTHPTHEDRVELLTQAVPAALKKRPDSCPQLSEYFGDFHESFRSM